MHEHTMVWGLFDMVFLSLGPLDLTNWARGYIFTTILGIIINIDKPYGHYASRRRSGKNSRCYN